MTEPSASDPNTETFSFQAEINQLMSLIINTFYSNKEIFLRELISNSSDAIDKIRHQSLTDKTVLDSRQDLYIHVVPDKKNNTLSIIDSGIGMTKNDLIKNLGTIAQSGTKNFMEALNAGTDINLIGQFGVGFYSAYLVASKVTVITKHNDDDHYMWESTAGGTFSVTKIEDSGLGRGTKMICELKDDQLEFLEEKRLKELVMKHSQYIQYPIYVMAEKTTEKEVTDDEEEEEEEKKEENDDSEPTIEEVDDKPEKEKKTKKIREVTNELELVNKNKPIWTRNPSDITKEEYGMFYKSISGDWEEHLGVKHFSVEGQLEFTALLFLPKRSSGNMLDNKKTSNLKLYVKRVYITDECNDILPDWLNFMHCIVDSEDLPLNISRETLQQNKIMKVIKKHIVKKCLELFSELEESEDDYNKFYEQYSKHIKFGIHEDTQHRSKLAELLRFQSTVTRGGLGTSLKNYVENMKDGQKDIYYIVGESLTAIENSPFLEMFNKREYEVLFMTDAIDEYMLQVYKEYDGKKIVSVSKAGNLFEETEEEKTSRKELEEKWKPFTDNIKTILNDKIEKVTLSSKLIDTPCVLVTPEYGHSANMQRIMRAQTIGNDQMSIHMMSKKILEVNPNNKAINELRNKFSKDKDDKMVKDLINLLFETSLLSSGFSLDDPAAYTSRIHRMVNLGLSLDENEDEEDEEDDLPPLENNDKSVEEMLEDIDNDNDMEDVD